MTGSFKVASEQLAKQVLWHVTGESWGERDHFLRVGAALAMWKMVFLVNQQFQFRRSNGFRSVFLDSALSLESIYSWINFRHHLALAICFGNRFRLQILEFNFRNQFWKMSMAKSGCPVINCVYAIDPHPTAPAPPTG